MDLKTPDEIKKGLESCNKGWQHCNECPYHTIGCDVVMCGDALEYIKQIEADNAQLNRCIENMTDKLNAAHDETAKLQAERDAAVADLKSYRCCHGCKHLGVGFNEPCLHCDFENNCFEWRGVQKEE